MQQNREIVFKVLYRPQDLLPLGAPAASPTGNCTNDSREDTDFCRLVNVNHHSDAEGDDIGHLCGNARAKQFIFT
jgi:hypothetical protein